METLTINIPEEKSSIVKEILKEFGVTIVDEKSNILQLSPEQREDVALSQKQIKNGLFVEQSSLDDEMQEWLKK